MKSTLFTLATACILTFAPMMRNDMVIAYAAEPVIVAGAGSSETDSMKPDAYGPGMVRGTDFAGLAISEMEENGEFAADFIMPGFINPDDKEEDNEPGSDHSDAQTRCVLLQTPNGFCFIDFG